MVDRRRCNGIMDKKNVSGKPGQTRYLGSDRKCLSMFPSPLICHIEEKCYWRDDRFLESCISDSFILFSVVEDRWLVERIEDTSRDQRTSKEATEWERQTQSSNPYSYTWYASHKFASVFASSFPITNEPNINSMRNLGILDCAATTLDVWINTYLKSAQLIILYFH